MYSKVGLSTILLTKSILYVTGACYWYWVMLLEILGPHADFNVAIKDTLQPPKMITIRPFHFTGYFWPEVIDSRLTFGQLAFQSTGCLYECVFFEHKSKIHIFIANLT